MSKKIENWDDVKTYDDADNFILHHGGTWNGQAGSHGKYQGPKGSVVLKQNHRGQQIPRGLLHKLKKELIAIGIIIPILVVILITVRPT